MKLIIGLGNPGLCYKTTRHNVGFIAVETLAKINKLEFRRNRFLKSLTAKGKVFGRDSLLILPQTYMNLSGTAVAQAVKRSNAAIEDILVICDDTAIPLGCIKIKPKGGHGGHKGLASIIMELKSNEFSRLRVGIGKQEEGRDLSDYVLAKFSRAEKLVLNKSLETVVEAVRGWIEEGIEKTMSNFNRKTV